MNSPSPRVYQPVTLNNPPAPCVVSFDGVERLPGWPVTWNGTSWTGRPPYWANIASSWNAGNETKVAVPSWATVVTPTVWFDFSESSSTGYAFSGWSNLQNVRIRNTGSIWFMESMFSYCTALTTVPTFDTHTVGHMSFMFYECSSLTEVPAFDTANVTGMSSMFYDCSSLIEVPAFDTASVTDMGAMFNGCWSLERAPLKNVKVDLDVSWTAMDAPALNELFDGLAPVPGKTIFIAGTPGADTCNRSIATAKGWTVTG